MEKEVYRIPYLKVENFYLVECIFNDSFKGFCVVDFKEQNSCLNNRYFRENKNGVE